MASPRFIRPSFLALASLAWGALALSMLGMGGLGLLALPLGWLAIRRSNASEGRLGGEKIAIAGMVLGLASAGLSLIGFLATIILPSWEANNRARCLNNLREIGQGANRYYDGSPDNPKQKGRFPPAAVPNADLPPEERLSWFAELLPYLPPIGEKSRRQPARADFIAYDLGWKAKANDAAAHTNIAIFQCPSFPNFDRREQAGQGDYVGIAGIDPQAAFLPITESRAGALGFDRQVTRDNTGRGVSYTMLATETTVHNGSWLAAGEPTLRGVDPNLAVYIGDKGLPFGGCHPGGANVVFLDSSARFLRDNISPRVFRAMATLVGPVE